MEDVRFFYQQANRCYQLAWQSFDLRVAQRHNLLGNEHTAKARELRSQGNVGNARRRNWSIREAPTGDRLSPGLPRGVLFSPPREEPTPTSGRVITIADSDLIEKRTLATAVAELRRNP